MSLATVLLAGFLLGLRHATEADHLAAVATLASRADDWRHAAKHGLAWGLGHALMLLGVCGVVLALNQTIDERLADRLEFAVGVMLIALGLDMLRRRIAPLPRVTGAARPPLRALAVGMVHGLAGSAALVALSVSAVGTWSLGLLYVVVFGVGSLVGMGALAAAMVLTLKSRGVSIALPARHAAMLIGLLSCGVGGQMVWQIATAGRLLGS